MWYLSLFIYSLVFGVGNYLPLPTPTPKGFLAQARGSSSHLVGHMAREMIYKVFSCGQADTYWNFITNKNFDKSKKE